MAASQWACSACTFLNSDGDGKCVMCNADRPVGDGTTVEVAFGEDEGEEWACKLCTVLNPPSFLACMVGIGGERGR